MTRLFGIAGVQMSVSPFDAQGTIDKMSDVAFKYRQKLALGKYGGFPRISCAGAGAISYT